MIFNASNKLKIVWVLVGAATVALWAWNGSSASAQSSSRRPSVQVSPSRQPSTPPTIAPAPVPPSVPTANGTLSAPTSPGASAPDTGRSIFDGDPGPASGDTKTTTGGGGVDINVDFGKGKDGEVPSKAVTIILGLTVLAVAPSILIMMTSFTRMVIVLSLARNAIGVQAVPPNQVMVGLAMFLTFFVMSPVLTQVNDTALQPYLKGEVSQSQALKAAEGPVKKFMLANTRKSDLGMMLKMQKGPQPKTPEDTSLVALIPAFVLSELQSAFIIGIVLFIPFVILDLVVSAVLMSLGMMMLPPVFVSMPLKLLLFVMVDGWALTTQALVSNYRGV